MAFGAWRALQGFLLRVPMLADRFDVRRAAAAASLPVTALYAIATGATVPVLRSAVAAGVVFAAILLGRKGDAAGALAIAALALLAVDPGCLVDVSFQLSFASVAGLVALSRPFREALPFQPDRARWWGRALEASLQGACASAAATVTTAPLLALHFRPCPPSPSPPTPSRSRSRPRSRCSRRSPSWPAQWRSRSCPRCSGPAGRSRRLSSG